jgi:hypothetical protein
MSLCTKITFGTICLVLVKHWCKRSENREETE